MAYIDFLKEQFSNYTVVEELQLSRNTALDTLIYKKLGGGINYKDSVWQPIQLKIKTNDISTALSALTTFSQQQSNSYFIDDLIYYKQLYSTPVVTTTLLQQGTNYTHEIILTGNLVQSSNISDITKITIDDDVYSATTAVLAYKAVEDTQPDNGAMFLGQTNVIGNATSFVVTLENKNNPLCNKVSRIRQGTLSRDTTFSIVLQFSDNERTESYTMRLTSSTLNTSNQVTPILTLDFSR